MITEALCHLTVYKCHTHKYDIECVSNTVSPGVTQV